MSQLENIRAALERFIVLTNYRYHLKDHKWIDSTDRDTWLDTAGKDIYGLRDTLERVYTFSLHTFGDKTLTVSIEKDTFMSLVSSSNTWQKPGLFYQLYNDIRTMIKHYIYELNADDPIATAKRLEQELHAANETIKELTNQLDGIKKFLKS